MDRRNICLVFTFIFVLSVSFVFLDYSGPWVKGIIPDARLNETGAVIKQLKQNIVLAIVAAEKIKNSEKRQKIERELVEMSLRANALSSRVARIKQDGCGFLGPVIRDTAGIVDELTAVIARIISSSDDFDRFHQAKRAEFRPSQAPARGAFFSFFFHSYLSHKIYFTTDIIIYGKNRRKISLWIYADNMLLYLSYEQIFERK